MIFAMPVEICTVSKISMKGVRHLWKMHINKDADKKPRHGRVEKFALQSSEKSDVGGDEL